MSRAKKHHGKSHKWVKKTRLAAVMRQGNKCHWCQRFMTVPLSHGPQLPTDATLEHVVPLADGGSRKAENTVAACAECNNTRPSSITQKQQVAAAIYRFARALFAEPEAEREEAA